MTRALFAAATLLALAGCGSDARPLDSEEAASHLVDRNWIDAWPEQRDDQLHVYRFVPSMGGGVYQDRTVFEGSFELFQFEVDGDAIVYTFPGRDEVHRTAYRIEEVDGPAPFTHRLVLQDSPRGPDTYYGWNEGSHSAPFRALVPR